jgi:hypothetical protein
MFQNKFIQYAFFYIVFLCLSAYNSFGQDTIQYVKYDVIYLKDGHTLIGEILSYDPQFGGISFKDKYGRLYNLGREEYKYFEEDQTFKERNKNKTVRPRKESGLGFNVGLGFNLINMNQNTEGDDYFVQDSYGNADIPVTLYGSVGKYFGRKHFVGLTADIGLISQEPGYYAFGARYVLQYDRNKKNTALYLPIEIKYQHLNMETGYRVNDTIWNDPYSYSFPGNVYASTSFNNLAVTIGHGFGFILKKSHAFNVELSYTKSFILSAERKETIPGPHEPNSQFSIGGFRMGLFYSF